jgi:aminopeptidase-like protein
MSTLLVREYVDRLWPLNRSITGNGLRESLRILQELIPVELVEVPTGTKVLDWQVPLEWNIEDAYLLDPSGKKAVDFKKSNLHVINYSEPVESEMTLEELEPHLHSIREQPDAIPYITSYYRQRWGFCLTHNQRRMLTPGKYKAVIKSSLKSGAMTYGHLVLPSTEGETREILLTSYLCHPSMGNNELAGPICCALIYQQLKAMDTRRFNYRFVLAPETIGAIAYLAKYGDKMKQNCHAGYVITCCGTDHDFTYKMSRRGNTAADRCAIHALQHYCASTKSKFQTVEFTPQGSDERQYCSPGYDLPVGSLMRAMYGTYPEYHTSLDSRELIRPESMLATVEVYMHALRSLEMNRTYLNTQPYGEPNLGSRGLYPTLSDVRERSDHLRLMLYILNMSDGKHDLCEIADRAGAPVWQAYSIAETLRQQNLLTAVQDARP